MSLYRVTVLLDDDMPYAPVPDTSDSSPHLATAFQWWKMRGNEVIGSGTAVGGSWMITTRDQLAILLLDVKGTLTEPSEITVKFSNVAGGSPSSPLAKPQLTLADFHSKSGLGYFQKRDLKGWYTQPLAIENSGKFSFTVDFHGGTSFYLDPEMDIDN